MFTSRSPFYGTGWALRAPFHRKFRYSDTHFGEKRVVGVGVGEGRREREENLLEFRVASSGFRVDGVW